MEIYWYDVVGNIGVLLILTAYLLLQIDRIESNSAGYSLLNALGAGLVLASLLGAFNLAAFVLEAFWLLISLWGLFARFRDQNSATVK
jgi:hypothetical protein